MNSETGGLRSYLQTIVVIVTLLGVIYMIAQIPLGRSLSSDAKDAAEVSQAILAGGEVSEDLLLAQLTGDLLEDLKSRGVISCAEGTCSVDTGVLVTAQDAASAAQQASAAGEQASAAAEQAKAGLKTIFANLLTTLGQSGNVVLRAEFDGDPQTMEAVVGFKGGLEAGTVKSFDEFGVEQWSIDTFRRYQSAPVQTSSDVTGIIGADLLGDGVGTLAVLSTDQRFFPSRISVITAEGTIASTQSGDIDYYHPGRLKQMEFFTGPDTRQLVFVGDSNAAPYVNMWERLIDLDLDEDGEPGEAVLTRTNLASVAFGIDPVNMIGQAPPGVEADVPIGQPAWYMVILPWGTQVDAISALDGSIALSHSCGYTFKLNSTGQVVEEPARHDAQDPACDGKLVGFLRLVAPNFQQTQLAEFSLIQTPESSG